MEDVWKSVVTGICCLLIAFTLIGLAITGSAQLSLGFTSEALGPAVTDRCVSSTVTAEESRVNRPSIQVTVSRLEKPTTLIEAESTVSSSRYSQFVVTYVGDIDYTDLTVTAPEDGAVVSTKGFTSVGDHTYQAQNASTGGSITYQYNITRLQQRTDNFAYYATSKSDNQMFSPVPQIKHRWATSTQTDTETHCDQLFAESANYTVSSSVGVTASPTSVFIGSSPHTVHTFSTSESTVRVISPEVITYPGQNIQSEVEQMIVVDRALAVNEPTQNVTVFSIDGARYGGGMLAKSSTQPTHATVWVDRNAPGETLGNTWVHEYVHTKQDFTLTSNMRWFSEASATYYSTLVPYQCRESSSDHYTAVLQANMEDTTIEDSDPHNSEPYNETVLSEPDSWGVNSEYSRGAVVLHLLDTQLRDSTDGRYTLTDVFRWLNTRNEKTSYIEFRHHIVSHSDESVGVWLDSAVMTHTELNASDAAPPEMHPTTESVCSVQLDREFLLGPPEESSEMQGSSGSPTPTPQEL